MNLTIRLRYRDEPQRPVAAWWLPGADAAEWLDAVSDLAADLAWRWIVIPHDAHGTVRGALVVPARQKDAAALRADQVPRGVPFGVVGDRLFVPIAASFDPSASDAEVAALLRQDDSLYVWLPAEGLVRCDATSLLNTTDLLVAPLRDETEWTAAEVGITCNRRLVSLRPATSLDLVAMFAAAREDIGAQAEHWDELPAAPGERSGWRIILPRLLAIAAMLLLIVFLAIWLPSAVGGLSPQFWFGLVGLLALAWLLLRWLRTTGLRNGRSRGAAARGVRGAQAGTSAGQSWLVRVRSWLAERRQRFDQRLEELRNRELRRLMHLLETRPDDGLRFALPLTGDAWYRGRARPGARLFERAADFSLNRLGGGGAADVWDVTEEYRRRLALRYRELATREIGLGRHRRAAYIFAELLGDLRSAAQTLADGGHYREAAALYEQRLKDTRAAAACLERGGLLCDAIPIYAGLGEFEKVGELYERLDQPDLAARAFRRAVDEKLEQSDFLSAAQLLDQRLHAPNEAYETLLRGWPQSTQAAKCLDESFDLLARLADHSRATRQIARLCAAASSSPTAVPLSTGLAKVANHYPDSTIRSLAADQVRVLVARRLDERIAAERETLLDSLRRLAPHDRLLQRDCERFRQATSQKSRSAAVAAGLRMTHEFTLPDGDWKAVVAHGREFYAAGWRGDEVVLVRGLWNGRLQQPAGRPWQLPPRHVGESILLGIAPGDNAQLLVHVLGHGGFATARGFPGTDLFAARPAGSSRVLDAQTLAIDVPTATRLTQLKLVEQGLAVFRYALPNMQLIDTQSVELGAPGSTLNFPDRWAFVDTGRHFYFGGSTGLYQVGARGATPPYVPLKLVTPDPVHQLTSFPREKLLAACGDESLTLWRGDAAATTSLFFSVGLPQPRAGFLRSSALLIASALGLEAYAIANDDVKLHGRMSTAPSSLPIAVLPLPHSRRAAVFTSAGQVRIYEVK